jgi:CRP-like cAMP-binding protein
MASQESSAPQDDNRILAVLPEGELQKLLRRVQKVSLAARHVIFEQGRPIRFVYFPLTAVVALLSVGEEGTRGIEVCTVGSEGIVGLSAIFNSDIALGRAVVQLPGTALRIDIKSIKEAISPGGLFDNILRRYTQVQLLSVSRSAFCRNYHKLEARLARLLLLTHDGAKADTFPMTHEFAAYLLGSHRPAISTAAHHLQAAGLISYRQGKITILDRQGLQAVVCECYFYVAREYERLLGGLLRRKS